MGPFLLIDTFWVAYVALPSRECPPEWLELELDESDVLSPSTLDGAMIDLEIIEA